MKSIAIFPIVVLQLVCVSRVVGENKSGDEVTFSVELDLGTDLGQSFGSIFEARNGKGRVVAGAGFQDVYNTRFRSDRHTLQFFVRPADDNNRFTISRLPHPDLDCGVYLFDLDEQLYAWSSVRNNSVRRWRAKEKEWRAELPTGAAAIRSGDGVMRLGKGRLVFSNNAVTYNDQQVLSGPKNGRDYNYYYAHGHLCFFRRVSGESGDETSVYACPWTPNEAGAVDLSRAVILKTKYERETPFAWGQFKKQILTVSNMGGIYVFDTSEDGSQWRTVLEPDNTVSYQVYSILHWHDRLLLAQYPTGNIFEYRGKQATRIEGWPPKLPGVSSSARECQTLSIYRGDLLAGVWPWAEVWRYDRDAKNWHSLGRLFTHPELTEKRTHPYEAEAKRLGLVTNHWGQRVTGMVPLGDSLFLSTSSKGTYKWDDRHDFITEEQRREYGAVLKMRMPGNLAAQIKWTDRPIRLEFVVSPKQISIRQDGKQIAAANLDDDFTVDLSELKVNWGEGVFGPLVGRSRSSLQRKQSNSR